MVQLIYLGHATFCSLTLLENVREGNLCPLRPPRECQANTCTSRGKPNIPPADRVLIDTGHKASKNPSNNADLGFQAVGQALHIMELNVEGLSTAKRHIIQSLAEIHHIDVISLVYEKKKKK